MAVHPSFRRGGRGDRLLKYCEEAAKEMGLKSIFVLTTRTEHWFLERGFIERNVDELPQERKHLYNLQRRSKVFVKKI